MNRLTVFLLFVFGITMSVSAQSVRMDVVGTVTDTLDAGLAGATVVLLNASDSALVSFGVTRSDGAFNLRRVPAGAYRLQVTFVGFEPYSAPIVVANETVDAGRIRMQPTTTELDALVVTAEHVPILVKRDTLEYNAAAFNVRPNASVEELLRRLPGVDVERDGTIKAQGETVEQVLVDGKEFFGADPTIATRNLPADAVDKVQVYDKRSDMAEFSGIDDGEETKTINLALKDESKQGYFGNVEGGFGNDLIRSRYEGKASIHRFTPTTQLSFIGNRNNINQQGFSTGDYVSLMGGMQSMTGGGVSRGDLPPNPVVDNGFSTITAAGLNFNRDFSSRTSLQSSYFLNAIDNLLDRVVNQRQIAGTESISRSLLASGQNALTQNHRFNLNLKHEFNEGQDIRLRADLRITDSELDNNTSRDMRDASDALVSQSNTIYDSGGNEWGGTASLTYRKLLSDKGRTLVGEASARLNDGSVKSNLEALTSFYENIGNVMSSEEILQYQSQFNSTLTNRQRLSWTEPLGGRRHLELHGERRSVYEDQNKDVFDRGNGSDVLNEALSSALKQSYSYGLAGLNFRFNREYGSFAVGVDVQSASLTGDVLDRSLRVDRRFVDLLPSATFIQEFSGGKTLDIRYRTSTREPSMEELQPFGDNSDPLNLYVGNPNLRPEYRHTGTVHFMLFDQFSFTNFFGYLQAQYAQNKISRARTIDEQFKQSSMPINVDGDWLLTSSLNFGTPIRSLGAKINLSTQTMFNRSTEYINDRENGARVLRQSIDLRLENRDKDVFDVQAGARFTFNASKYSLSPELDKNYLNRTFYTELSYYLGEAWRFTTALDYRLFADEVFGTGRQIPLWRAGIARTLLQNKAEIQLVGLDLLDKNVGINYSNASNYIQEEEINSLGRYVMLKFVYNLSGMGNRGANVHTIGH